MSEQENKNTKKYTAQEVVTKLLDCVTKIYTTIPNNDKQNQLVGGVGDKTPPSAVDAEELAMGIEVEMEHTVDQNKAKEIALDHLTEDPKYYTHLAEMEAKYVHKSMDYDILASLEKSMFPSKSKVKVDNIKYVPTKADIMSNIVWQIKRSGEYKDLKHLIYSVFRKDNVEDEDNKELNAIKVVFEEYFNKQKQDILTLVDKYKELKKSNDGNDMVIDVLTKSLFEDKLTLIDKTNKTNTKKEVSEDLCWQLKELKNIIDLKGIVVDYFANHPNFERIKQTLEFKFAEKTKRIANMAKEFTSLKKNEVDTVKEPDKEDELSVKPPKEWWDKKYASVKSGNPNYSDEQISSTVGSIWYKKMNKKQKSSATKSENKGSRKSPLQKFIEKREDKVLTMKDIKWVGKKPKGRSDEILTPSDPYSNAKLTDLESQTKVGRGNINVKK